MKKVLSVFLAVILLSGFCLPCFSEEQGKTYYVDCEAGNDAFDGTSPASAWKTVDRASANTYHAGDSILFRAGGIFNGHFTAKGSATAEMPVVMGAYGDTVTDGLPVIRCDSEGTLVDIRNVSGWIVENMEFTAPNGAGIAISADNETVCGDIIIRNCVFHDISNRQYKSNYPILISSSGKDSRLDNITVKDCDIYDCGYGIAMGGLTREWTPEFFESPEKSYNTDYLIEGVDINNLLYDGIIICSVYGMTIRNCTLLNTCLVDDHYTAPMWSHHASNFVIENCEIAGALNEKDGMSVDFDGWTTDAMYQYCYSHDNVRFINNCCYDNYTCNDNCVVRYCLSVNDNKGGNGMAQILTAGCEYKDDEYAQYMTNYRFYNNTVINFSEFNLIGLKDALIANNIFVGKGISSSFRFARKVTDDEGNKFMREYDGTMTNNCFWNCAVPSIAKNSRVCNPGFVSSDITDKNSFKLCKASGLIGEGIKIENMGEYDFYGNTLSDTVNIGCYGSDGEEVTVEPDFFGNLKSMMVSVLATIYNFIYTCNDKYWIF